MDTDFSGTASNPCPEPDKDHDGYPSSAAYDGIFGAGVDCDDTNFWIHPGGLEDTAGCSAGEYRTCQSNGSYSACAAISSFTCHSGAGATYWVDDAETDCTGAGTNADPEDWRCWANSAMTGYHAPVAGDCIVFQPGTYSSSFADGGSTRQFYINNKDGTSSNPIIFRSQPGAIPGYSGKVLIAGATTSPTVAYPIHMQDSNYVRVFGFEIDGTSDFSQVGIHLQGGTDPRAYLNYVHNIDGVENNNVACIECQNDTVGCFVHHNIVRDCYEVGDATAQNNMQIRVMDDTGDVKFWYNIIPNSTTVGGGLDCKHQNQAGTGTTSIRGNFVDDVTQYVALSECRNSTINNNWGSDCTGFGFQHKQLGSSWAWLRATTISYNTLQRCALFNGSGDWDDLTNHRTCNSGTCTPGGTVTGCCYPDVQGSAGSATSSIVTLDHNIMSDDNASYDGDEGDGVTRWCEYNCIDGERTAAAGKVVWSNNVYYSSGTSDLRFGWFGQAGGGADYAGLAAWQAAGFDSGSVQADPSLDADGISATYNTHGWSVGLFSAAAATPTPTPTPSIAGCLISTDELRRRR